VNEIYRLMKSGVAKRVLFLVDRRALAAQAVRTFSSFDAEPGQKFNQVYEVYSSKFQREDFGKKRSSIPSCSRRLSDGSEARPSVVYVATIQRMAINVLGGRPSSGWAMRKSTRMPASSTSHPRLRPHRRVRVPQGLHVAGVSVWRSTLDHFDAIKVGSDGDASSHTTAYFNHKVYEYSYEQAVREGYLVDYDVVKVRSNVRMNGVFLKEGENVEYVDPETGLSKMDQLEDERPFDAAEIETKVTAPESNRKVLEEVKKHAIEHETRYGRFPKTLIFAANDLPHTSHADQLVDFAREVFGRGDSFVEKITGRVDRPLQRIREFRNRKAPGIAVTVESPDDRRGHPGLGVHRLPAPVKSRILFEQMLGRGTRKGEQYTDKDHFTVFDCFDGTLLAYFKTQLESRPKNQPSPPEPSRRSSRTSGATGIVTTTSAAS